jgi:hypothetical protein
MNASEAKALYDAACRRELKETERRAEPFLAEIDANIREAASAGRHYVNVEIRSEMIREVYRNRGFRVAGPGAKNRTTESTISWYWVQP